MFHIGLSHHNENATTTAFNLLSSVSPDSTGPKLDQTIGSTGPPVANLLTAILSHPSDVHSQFLPNNATATPLFPSSPPSNPSSNKTNNEPLKLPSPILSDVPSVNHPSSSAAQPSPLDTPSKKNGKPLAKCSFCGMTFKKLEHCQRHERTHTLARPYSCTVCLKAFARQDTLNRHLRLHSRAEGRIALNRSSSQSQHSHTPANPSASFITAPARERGLSLSALDQSSFVSDLRRDNLILTSGPRHSLPLLPSRGQSDHLAHQSPSLFSPHCNQTQSHSSPLNNSDLPLQLPPRFSSSRNEGITDGLTSIRRASWCPEVQPFAQTPMLSTIGPPRVSSNRSHRQHAPEPLCFGSSNWEANLTNTFGLIEAGISPTLMSAPATCTKWSALGLPGDIQSSEITTSPSMTCSWNKPVSFQPPPSSLPYWDALGRLEEEDHTKLERELNMSSHPTQPIVSTRAAVNEPLIQSAPIESSFSPRVPSTIVPDLQWSYPAGSNLIPSFADQYQHPPPIPVGVVHRELPGHFGTYWNKNQTPVTVEMIDPKSWYPPPCLNPEDSDARAINNPDVPNSNTLAFGPGWKEVMELGF